MVMARTQFLCPGKKIVVVMAGGRKIIALKLVHRGDTFCGMSGMEAEITWGNGSNMQVQR